MGMNTHEAAFMAEILASPTDDAPRLLLADWMDENGQPERAEFVRVQVALSRPCPLGRSDAYHVDDVCEPCHALRLRERELLGRTESMTTRQVYEPEYSWLPAPIRYLFEMGPREGRHDRFWKWRRGFVEGVECTAANFLAHADALTVAAPIREVRLTTWPEVALFTYDGSGQVARVQGIKAQYQPSSIESEGDMGRHLLRLEWPRINFTLPPVVGWNTDAGDIGESLRALRDQFIRDA